MKIDIISIAKKEKTIYDPLYKDLTKMISRFAKVQDIEIFPKDVAKSHTISQSASQKAYTKVLEPYTEGGFNIIYTLMEN
jgi:23S rRNA (pseudouridine1915-N3)-methyltransferase